MQTIHLDTSGLRNIRLETDGMPNSIYVDGQDFINRLSQTLQEVQYQSPEEIKEKRRWELIKSLSSNPEFIKDRHMSDNADQIIKQADCILKTLEELTNNNIAEEILYGRTKADKRPNN